MSKSIVIFRERKSPGGENIIKGGTDLDFLMAGTGKSLIGVEVGNCPCASPSKDLLL